MSTINKVISSTINSAKLTTYQQFLQKFPWNFTSHTIRKDVKSLKAPMDLERYLPLELYNGYFKDYAEAIVQNDLNQAYPILEPSFGKQFAEQLELLHRETARYGYQLNIEYNRKRSDETDFFLYNVESYYLIGMDVDRRKRKTYDKYLVNENEQVTLSRPKQGENKNEIIMEEQELAMTQVIDTEELNEESKAFLVMRLHFVVNSFLNIYVWDPKNKQVIFGNKIEKKNDANKKSHLVIIDKLVSEMHVGDTLYATPEEQMRDKVIQNFSKSDGIFISDFDNFMNGNPFVPSHQQIDIDGDV